MNLASIFSSINLKPSWQFSAQNILWRVMFSENGLILGEDRDTEKKMVTFFCIGAKNGKPLWTNKTFGDQWWIGLDGVTSDRLYLHRFRKPDMPEHKSIIAVELRTGNLIWQNSECTFLALHPPFVFGYKDLFERRVYYKIEGSTGETIEELQTIPAGIEPNMQYEKTDFLFPNSLTENEEQLWNIVHTVKEFASAEFIDIGRLWIINLYTRHADPNNGLKNSLIIIDSTTKKKVYSDVLNEFTQYAVPDSFFLDKNTLYYIKERKTFVALNLST